MSSVFLFTSCASGLVRRTLVNCREYNTSSENKMPAVCDRWLLCQLGCERWLAIEQVDDLPSALSVLQREYRQVLLQNELPARLEMTLLAVSDPAQAASFSTAANSLLMVTFAVRKHSHSPITRSNLHRFRRRGRAASHHLRSRDRHPSPQTGGRPPRD